MRITLNELRNLVKNILKENIQFPSTENTDKNIREVFMSFSSEAKQYLKDNIKFYDSKKEEFTPLNNVEFSLGNFNNDSIPEGTYLKLEGTDFRDLSIWLYTNEWAKSRGLGNAGIQPYVSGDITLESMDKVNILAEFISNVFSTFMKKNVNTQNIISTILPYIKIKKSAETPDYIKGATDATSSSEFRRGGGRNQGKLGGDYKSKFGNEPAEEPVTSSGGKTYANYNEWIGNESAENQKAIAVLYRMVEKGRMEEDEFDSEIQELLNTPLNEIRKLIKNVLKETKKNKFKR
jgi:hypothetical protein